MDYTVEGLQTDFYSWNEWKSMDTQNSRNNTWRFGQKNVCMWSAVNRQKPAAAERRGGQIFVNAEAGLTASVCRERAADWITGLAQFWKCTQRRRLIMEGRACLHPRRFRRWNTAGVSRPPWTFRVMFPVRHFTSRHFFCSYQVDDGIFLRNSLCPNPWLFSRDFKYFVFFSSVEICIYMFNKTRYDLLPVGSSFTAGLFRHACFGFTVRAEGRLRKQKNVWFPNAASLVKWLFFASASLQIEEGCGRSRASNWAAVSSVNVWEAERAQTEHDCREKLWSYWTFSGPMSCCCTALKTNSNSCKNTLKAQKYQNAKC